MVTQERLKELMTYDPVTGLFTRIKCTSIRQKEGEFVGVKAKKGAYLKCSIDYKEYLLHRLVFLYLEGYFPRGQVDHINHDGLDNRLENLRTVSREKNQQNMSRSKSNTSGITGVSYDKSRNKWVAQILANGVYKSKRFTTKFGAIRQRIKWNKEHNFHDNHGKLSNS